MLTSPKSHPSNVPEQESFDFSPVAAPVTAVPPAPRDEIMPRPIAGPASAPVAKPEPVAESEPLAESERLAESESVAKSEPVAVPVTRAAPLHRGGLGFDYQIKLSRRRTMVVTVDECEVIVAAPLRTCKGEIHAWLVEKQPWIRRKLKEQAIKAAERPTRSYTDGEQWPILGQHFSLYLGSGSRAAANLVDGNLLKLTLSTRSRQPKLAQVRALMHDWYKEQAQHYLEHRSHEMAEVLGVTVKSVKIRLTKSKWGHCTPDGVLQYNYLIMQAPKAVADYLVAHEVSHRVHLNHSAAFWRTVAKLCPDHLEQRAWLRENSHLLTF